MKNIADTFENCLLKRADSKELDMAKKSFF